MPCKTCQHPQHQAIDLALLEGNATLCDLSEQYGLSTSSLFRHKKHLDFQLARTREKFQHRRRQDILFQYNEFLQETREHARTAKAEGNTRLALQATSAGVRILNAITRLDVQLDDDTTYRLLASPDWVSQDSLFPTDPQFRAACRQSLSHEFFSPCPEIPLADDQDTEAAPPATTQREASDRAPKSQRQISAKLPRKSRSKKENSLHYQPDSLCEKNIPKNPLPIPSSLFPGASLTTGSQPNNDTPSSQIEICCFPCAAPPRNQRDMSAKSARNSRPLTENNMQSQQDNQREKSFAKNSPAGPQNDAPPAVPQPCLPPNAPCSPFPLPFSLLPGSSPTGNQIPETISPETSPGPPSPVSGPSSLTPEIRRQLFTPLFPKGDGAMDPEKIEAPEKMPPLPHPQKRNKLKKLLHFFQKKSELPPEAAQCQSPAPSALDQDATRPAATPIPFPLKSCKGTPFFTKILDFHCNRGSIS